MKSVTIKYILFAILFTWLLLPRVVRRLDWIVIRPLSGEFIPAEKNNFTIDGWLSGEYQEGYDRYYEENLGARTFLIRLYNQVDYSLFNVIHGEAVPGKKGFLFQELYLNASIGKDFIGEKNIRERVEKIKYVRSKLAEKDILVIIAIAPSKVRFYPEYIPRFYSDRQTTKTNYEYHKRILREEQVPFIDFIDYFGKIKDTSRWALYPRQGIHWSQYGMFLAADSMLNYIEKESGLDLNSVHCRSVELSASLRSTDYDLGDISNVLITMPHDPMPYPVLQFESDPHKERPNVLVIGDSYYWNIYYTEIPAKIFSGRNFWYYNHELYTDSIEGKRIVSEDERMPAVEKQKVILIIQTESNLNKLGFHFFEQAYDKLRMDTLSVP